MKKSLIALMVLACAVGAALAHAPPGSANSIEIRGNTVIKEANIHEAVGSASFPASTMTMKNDVTTGAATAMPDLSKFDATDRQLAGAITLKNGGGSGGAPAQVPMLTSAKDVDIGDSALIGTTASKKTKHDGGLGAMVPDMAGHKVERYGGVIIKANLKIDGNVNSGLMSASTYGAGMAKPAVLMLRI